MTEATINASLIHVLCLFAEIDVFKDWFPEVTDATVLRQLTNYKAMYTCKQNMPWPLWPREMIFSATGIFDKNKKSCLSVMKSVESGKTWFGTPVPDTADGFVRVIIKRGYHYFERIDDNTTKYICIFNTDP